LEGRINKIFFKNAFVFLTGKKIENIDHPPNLITASFAIYKHRPDPFELLLIQKYFEYFFLIFMRDDNSIIFNLNSIF